MSKIAYDIVEVISNATMARLNRIATDAKVEIIAESEIVQRNVSNAGLK